MNFNNLQQLIDMIASQNTGEPAVIATKLGVTERMVYKYIDMLKTDFNVPIKYNRASKTYYFTEEGRIGIKWQEDNKFINNIE
jgi:predicted DNA-binding transcriptional regulator YafY